MMSIIPALVRNLLVRLLGMARVVVSGSKRALTGKPFIQIIGKASTYILLFTPNYPVYRITAS